MTDKRKSPKKTAEADPDQITDEMLNLEDLELLGLKEPDIDVMDVPLGEPPEN